MTCCRMMNAPADLTDAVLGFCRRLRGEGMNVGVAESLSALDVARLGPLTDPRTFRLGLRALLCTSREERDRFDALFDAYWLPAKPRTAYRHRMTGPVTREQTTAPLHLFGNHRGEGGRAEEGKRTTGASATERLRTTDFSQVTRADQVPLEELAQRLWKQMSLRLSRRLRVTPHGRQVHLRRTIRRNIPHGGDLVELRYRGRRVRKPRLVVFLDVSGSMDAYSFFFLRFIHALQQHFRRVDSFTFSTRLTCVSDVLRRRLPDSLRGLAEREEGWSGGTRIGACLEAFHATYGRQMLSRNALVLILSDGLDTGPPEQLAEALRRFRGRVQKLIWLNPLLGMEGYQPVTRGLRAALPHVDAFVAAHNLESLLALEPHLTHV